MNVKEAIINEAKKIGIDIIGFTSALPFKEVENIIKDRESRGFLSGFEESDISKRINPQAVMKDCRTIISTGISYNVEIEKVKHKADYRHKSEVSRCSWGTDYHSVLGAMLNTLSSFIEYNFAGSAATFVDTNPLVEREIARRAGIGYTGKNCSIINSVNGSYIFLGEILTNIYIEEDSPIVSDCGDCEICINACPTGALCSPYTINAKKCVSYITQSKDITAADYINFGNNIYGCDVCQRVCPKNKAAKISTHVEFMPELWNAYPDAVDLLELDNKSFKNTFKKTSSGWRGKKNIQRNAIIVLGNSGNKQYADYIKEMLSDERSDIRKAALYSLYNLLGKDSAHILEGHLINESSEDIRDIVLELLKKE